MKLRPWLPYLILAAIAGGAGYVIHEMTKVAPAGPAAPSFISQGPTGEDSTNSSLQKFFSFIGGIL